MSSVTRIGERTAGWSGMEISRPSSTATASASIQADLDALPCLATSESIRSRTSFGTLTLTIVVGSPGGLPIQ